MEKERRQNNEWECYQRQAKGRDGGWQDNYFTPMEAYFASERSKGKPAKNSAGRV